MKIVGIIPARYASTRFPGKPLADICGKTMIQHVWEAVNNIEEFDALYVTTDDERIADSARAFGANVLMTDDEPNATARVAAAVEEIYADAYVIVMGDEPLLTRKDIKSVYEKLRSGADACILATTFETAADVVDNSNIKLVINSNDELIYMSRAAIPYPQTSVAFDYYKNVGVYGFSAEAIKWFKSTNKGKTENIEDMEMLRFCENHKVISVCYTENKSISVDTPKDLERIRLIMERKPSPPPPPPVNMYV